MKIACTIRLITFVVAGLVAASAQAQRHVNHAKGFEPEKVVLAGEIDAINPFNGNLTLVVPIGISYPVSPLISYRLSLTYNANLWDFEEVGHDTDGDNVEETWGTAAYPDRRANAGLGWSLSLGRLLPEGDPTTDSPFWIYESPDGAEHAFYEAGSVAYTKDNTHLRMRSLDAATRLVEFPDGTVHTFKAPPSGGPWRLTEIRDPHLHVDGTPVNFMKIEYHDGTDGFVDKWTVTDSHGRLHYVHFGRAGYDGTNKPVVDLIQLAGPESTSVSPVWSEYSFNYTPDDATRPCEDTDAQAYGGTPATAFVPYLMSVGAPDGTLHSFDYARGSGTCVGWNGLITHAILPTLGKIEWGYDWYRMPIASASEPYLQLALGVESRTLYSETNTEIGEATYSSVLDRPWNDETERPTEMRTTVTDALSNETVHYYAVATEPTANGFTRQDYGMPYTKNVTSGDFHLSTRTYSDAGTLLRSNYVLYERENLVPNSPNNRRLRSARTVFHDDALRRIDVIRDDYDELGHYRSETTESTFPDSPTRTSFTNYNPGSSVPDPSDPWITATFDQQKLTQGTKTFTRTFCFDAQTGFLLGQRTLGCTTDGCSTAATDVVVLYSMDAAGNRVQEDWFGGDTQDVSSITSLCDPESDSRYRITHGYQYGSLARSEYHEQASPRDGLITTVDLTIDQATGLVVSSRDTAGLETAFEYDLMGRLEGVTSPGTAALSYDYKRAGTPGYPTAAILVSLDSSDVDNDSTTTLRYDAFGRLRSETREMPVGTTTRETRYDALGRKGQVSEWQSVPSSFTAFTYDSFGRPLTITLPDGKVTTFSYLGIRQTTRNVSVGTTLTGTSTVNEAVVATKERYDHHGRLIEVEEPGMLAKYAYDAADRLTSVTMNGELQQPPRTFTYDGRGFLTSESHPESGISRYSSYDARGHAGKKDVGDVRSPFDLRFVYDDAERLTEIWSRYPEGYWMPDPSDPYRLTKEFRFSTENDLSRGKLATSVRHNHVPGLGEYVVEEDYGYGDLAGRLTDKDTTIWKNEFGMDPILYQTLSQSFTYDDLGQETEIDYPLCLLSPCGETAWTQLSQTYSEGYLQSISGFVNGVTYHPNGLIDAITHSNGIVVEHQADSNGMARPRSIQVIGAIECESPEITSQPQSQAIVSGGTATLNITVAATPELAYQWYEGPAGDLEDPIAGATSSTYTTPSLTTPAEYWVKVTSTCGDTSSSASVGVARSTSAAITIGTPAPSGLIATRSAPTSVTVSWTASDGAIYYELYRRSGGASFERIGGDLTGTSFESSGLAAGTTYVFRVRAVDASSNTSAFSNHDAATTMTFTTIQVGSVVDDAHFHELLAGVNGLRAANGWQSVAWADILPAGIPAPAQGVMIHAVHIEALRTRMNEALTGLGVQVLPYSDPELVDVPVRLVHLNELRQRTQ